MGDDVRASIVRVLSANGDTAGTGFVVSDDGLIATCAHVVQGAGGGPGGTLRVAFHTAGQERQATIVPEFWRDPAAQDVAILRVDTALPGLGPSLPLGHSDGSTGHDFDTFGLPVTNPNEGLGGDGRIVAATTIQGVEVLQLSSVQVTQGFSGAPVLDRLTRRVVGMVTGITPPDQYQRGGTTAFATPSETLQAVCPTLRFSDVCPYRRLAAFTTADARFLCGRQRVIDLMLDNLRREPRFLAVLGPSGSGKSSVVQAGLIPHLRQAKVPGSDHWGNIVIRQYDHPFDALAAAGLPGAADGLTDAVRRYMPQHPDQSRLVLVLDQFEELVISSVDSVAQSFLAQVTDLLSAALPITVILVMRDDFYSRFAQQMPSLLEWLPRGLVNVPPTLTPAEVTAIVREPAAAVGLLLEDGLAERIVSDALETAAAPDDAGLIARSTILPVLEFALTELWERRQDGMLTHGAYGAIGEVTGGLSQWADQAYAALAEQRLGRLARRTFTDLVRLGDPGQGLPDSRQRKPVDALYRQDGERDAVNRVMRRLVGEHLLVTARDEQTGHDTVEIIHDALLREWGQLRQWLREDRRFLVWHQDIERRAEAWIETAPQDTARRDEGRLLRGGELAEAERWLGQREADLTEEERAFLQASRAVQARERQRVRRRLMLTVGGLAAGLVAISIAAAFAFTQWRDAVRQRDIALAGQLSALAVNKMDDQFDLALLLSVEAMRIASTTGASTAEARKTLLTAVQHDPDLITFLRRQAGPVTSVAFSPGGRVLASGSTDGTIVLWDVAAQRPLAPPLTLHSPATGGASFGRDGVASIAFSPDGRILAAGRYDGVIQLWDVAGRQPLGPPLRGHTDTVSSMAFSPDGTTLISAGDDHTIRLWDAVRRRALGAPLKIQASLISSMALSPDDKTVAVGTEDFAALLAGKAPGAIQLWDIARRQPRGAPLRGRLKGVDSLAFSPRGTMLAAAGPSYSPVLGKMLSPNGPAVIQLWNVARRTTLGRPLVGHTGTVEAMAFSRDGRTLASGGDDQTIRLWDVTRQQVLGPPLRGHGAYVLSVAFSPDGRTVASGGADRAVLLWGVGRQRSLSAPLSGHTGAALSVAFSPDGRILASGSRNQNIVLWDVAGRRPLSPPLAGHTDAVSSVAFSPDGRILASGSADKTVRLWDVARRRPLGTPLLGHTDVVNSVAFSPDGRILASGSADKSVRLWDVARRRPLGHPIVGFPAPVTAVAFSPDGKILAMSDAQGNIWQWDMSRQRSAHARLIDVPVAIYSLAFSSDGKTLASGSADKAVLLSDVGHRPPSNTSLNAHTGAVFSVAFSPDGRTLASGSQDKTIVLWDVASQQPLGVPLTGHTDTVWSLAFSPDGKTLASGSLDQTIRLWSVDPAAWAQQACRIANRNLSPQEWTRYLGTLPYHVTCPQIA